MVSDGGPRPLDGGRIVRDAGTSPPEPARDAGAPVSPAADAGPTEPPAPDAGEPPAAPPDAGPPPFIVPDGGVTFPPGYCPAGPGTRATDDQCQRITPQFLEQVESALEIVLQRRPELFDFTQNVCWSCPKVLDAQAYMQSLVETVRELGLCATLDPFSAGDEIGVKNSNDFAESYDYLRGDGFVRRGSGAYQVTCVPAWF
jgi:hypothetical protein